MNLNWKKWLQLSKKQPTTHRFWKFELRQQCPLHNQWRNPTISVNQLDDVVTRCAPTRSSLASMGYPLTKDYYGNCMARRDKAITAEVM